MKEGKGLNGCLSTLYSCSEDLFPIPNSFFCGHIGQKRSDRDVRSSSAKKAKMAAYTK